MRGHCLLSARLLPCQSPKLILPFVAIIHISQYWRIFTNGHFLHIPGINSPFKAKSESGRVPRIIAKAWWKSILCCSFLLIFKLRRKRWQIYIIEIAVYGENGRNWINSRPADKKFTEDSRQICENSKFGRLGEIWTVFISFKSC